MKVRLTILLCASLLFMAFDHHKQVIPQNDWQELNLRGEVKECTEYNFGADDKGEILDTIMVTKYTFNRLGLIASQVEYDTLGMIRTFYFTFYPNGKYKERKGRIYKHENYDGPYTMEDYYDTNGNDIYAEEIDTNGKAFEKSWSRYDAKGNFIEEDDSNAKSKKRYVAQVNSYDVKGNLVKRWRHSYGSGNDQQMGIGENEGFSTVVYDANGFEIKEYDTNNGRFGEWIEMVNDKWGNCIEERFYDEKNKLTERNKTQYDSVGREIGTEDYNKLGILEEKDAEKYDKYGNQVMGRSKGIGDPRELEEDIYTYDNKGNWIKDTYKYNREIISVKIRKLVYY